VLKVIPSCRGAQSGYPDSGRIFRAAGGLRLGGIFGNQIKQVVAVNIVFTQRRRLADMGFNVFDRLRSAAGRPADGEYCQRS
jgi:hypothetical protein